MLTPLLSKGIGFPGPSGQGRLSCRSTAPLHAQCWRARTVTSLGLKVFLWRFSPFCPGEGGFIVGRWSNAAAEGWDGEIETHNLHLGFYVVTHRVHLNIYPG